MFQIRLVYFFVLKAKALCSHVVRVTTIVKNTTIQLLANETFIVIKTITYTVIHTGTQMGNGSKKTLTVGQGFSVLMRHQTSIFTNCATSGHVCRCEKELVVFSLLLKLLETIPPEDFLRTWAASRTYMVRRSSKKLKNLVKKLCFTLPTVVLLRKVHDARVAELAEFAKIQAWCRITTLDLGHSYRYVERLDRHETERLSSYLTQIPSLTQLDLSSIIREGTVGILARGLGHCRELVHLNLSGNYIDDTESVCFEGVLRQCDTLAHVDLSYNGLDPSGTDIHFRELSECTALTHLDCRCNHIGDSTTDSLTRVLV